MTSPDFEALLAVLRRARFQFVVVGGYSAMLSGSTLMTRDIDVVCPLTPDNLGCLWTALSDLHPVHRMHQDAPPFTAGDTTRTDWQNLYLRTDLGILDCSGDVRGLGPYEACLARSQAIELGGHSVRVLTLEALIDAKRAMGRPRDLHTVEELDIIREQQGRDYD